MVNKIILACYIDLSHIEAENRDEYVNNFKNKFKILEFDKDIIMFFIPQYEEKTSIQLIYPLYVVDKEVKEKQKMLLKKLEKFLDDKQYSK